MNLFDFEYQVEKLQHGNGEESKWGVLKGQGGHIVYCKRDTYTPIRTQDVSRIGEVLIEQGMDVRPYTHKHGEIIGLNVDFGQKPTQVGDIKYGMMLNIINNGTGAGRLSLSEKRLVCANGMTRTTKRREGAVTIPHNSDYQSYLEVAKKSMRYFETLVAASIEQDAILSKETIDTVQFRMSLAEWFWAHELGEPQRKELKSFDKFRAAANGFAEPLPPNWQRRWDALMAAAQREQEYNEPLSLELSRYTVLATVTNYLSRQIEASQSAAPNEVQLLRKEKKVAHLCHV